MCLNSNYHWEWEKRKFIQAKYFSVFLVYGFLHYFLAWIKCTVHVVWIGPFYGFKFVLDWKKDAQFSSLALMYFYSFDNLDFIVGMWLCLKSLEKKLEALNLISDLATDTFIMMSEILLWALSGASVEAPQDPLESNSTDRSFCSRSFAVLFKHLKRNDNGFSLIQCTFIGKCVWNPC